MSAHREVLLMRGLILAVPVLMLTGAILGAWFNPDNRGAGFAAGAMIGGLSVFAIGGVAGLVAIVFSLWRFAVRGEP